MRIKYFHITKVEITGNLEETYKMWEFCNRNGYKIMRRSTGCNPLPGKSKGRALVIAERIGGVK